MGGLRARCGPAVETSATAPLGRWDAVFSGLAASGAVVLLVLGRSLAPWFDEWRFIDFDGGAAGYLAPFNEHWVTLPLLLYRGTLAVFGLHSYLPYLGEVVVLHVSAVAGAYLLIRRRMGPAGATLVAFPLLYLGVGAENLFWAYQSSFVGSVMLGVWALYLIERPERSCAVAAGGLLVAGVAFSGMGLFFVAAAFGHTILAPHLRRRVWVVLPAAGVYAAWYAAEGASAVGGQGPLATPGPVVSFVWRGIGYSTVALLGFDGIPGDVALGVGVFAALVSITVVGLVRASPVALAGGCLLAVGLMYTLIAFVRAGLDWHDPKSSRYTYVAAFLLVLAMADLVGSRLSTRMLEAHRGRAIALGLVVVYAASVGANLHYIQVQRQAFEYRADLTRTYIALALTRRDEPWVDGQSHFGFMPPLPELVRLVERIGYEPDLRRVSSGPREPGFADAVLTLMGKNFGVQPARPRGAPVPLELLRGSEGVTITSRECIVSPPGRNVSTMVSSPGAVRLRLAVSSPARGTVGIGYSYAYRYSGLSIQPNHPVDVVIPGVPDVRRWQLTFAFPDLHGRLAICASRDGMVVQ